jgi:hypothetical protein
LAGLGVADSLLLRRGRSRVALATAWVLMFLAPVNVLAFVGCFRTPNEVMVTDAEASLSAWAQAHTERDAVFIDDDELVFLLVTGPRRYYWGRWAYAQQWGYPRAHMAQRYHAVRSVYGGTPLDAVALDALASVRQPLYVIARPGHGYGGSTVLDTPLFRLVYDADDLSVYRVDREACQAAAATAIPGPTTEELIRESGL